MKLRSVQVLRGVAACAVALMHARLFSGSPIGDSATRLGAAGVDLFFVISGFIMASIPKPTAAQFLFDRFWRVIPMWLLAAAPWLIFRGTSWPLVPSLTLWPIFGGKFLPPVLPVGWTLSFEALFYVAIATAMISRWTVPVAAFTAALIIGILTRWPMFDYLGNPMIFEFLFGVAIALLPRRRWLAPWLMVAAIGCFIVAPLDVYQVEIATDAHRAGWRALSWGLPAAGLVYAAVSMDDAFANRLLNPLVRLGDASYSIYLTHLAIVMFFAVPWPLAFIASVLMGVLVWWYVEKPIQAAKPRWTGRAQLSRA